MFLRVDSYFMRTFIDGTLHIIKICYMKASYTYFILIVLSIFGFIPNLQAQPGSNDATFNTFNPTGINFDYAGGANDDIYAMALQSDGKIIIGGFFTSYNGVPMNRIARLNADGSLDTTFDIGTGASSMVESISIQPDGKIIIAGYFLAYNGTTRMRIARLNTNGSLDTSFNPGTGTSNRIQATAIQPDGKILIGGNFTSFQGLSRNLVARLNADGSIDSGFNSVLNSSGTVRTILVESNGKIILGGEFYAQFGSNGKNNLVRLNANGSVDGGLGGIGTNDVVYAATLQSDSKILIAGDFLNVHEVAKRRIARLNTNGTIDTGFDIGFGTNGSVRTLSLLPNGKILLAGNFSSFDGIPANRIARINSDGSFDSSFSAGTGANNFIYSSIVQPNGNIFLAGTFSTYNGTTRNKLVHLKDDGSLENGFFHGTGANGNVWTTAVQPNGKIIVGGQFTSYNGTASNSLVRLNANGTVDQSFNIGTGANGIIRKAILQPDGKIIIVGGFTSFNGTNRNRVARLNSDGSLDTSFNPSSGANSVIYTVALQTDGKILIGGSFTSFAGNSRNRIARLNSNGTHDASFNPGTGAPNLVYSIVLQLNGKILVGGSFTAFADTAMNRIARLNVDGSLDNDFNIGTGANNTISEINLFPNGKIMISGDFSSFNGNSRNRIARLNANGTHDASFNPGTGSNNIIHTSIIQPDGKTIIGGAFTSFDGTSRNRIARLNINGSLDISFNLGAGANSIVQALAIQADGKILVGGDFTSYNATPKNRFTRLNINGSMDEPQYSLGSQMGANGKVNKMILQSDEKIIIGGAFSSFDGIGANNIARLNSNGSLDNSFNSGTGTNGEIFAVALQSDGKIIIGGAFTTYNGTPSNNIARLNADGSLDSSFPMAIGANDEVYTIATQPNGKVVIGGRFTNLNFTNINHIARLNANGSIDTSFDPGSGAQGNVRAVILLSNGKLIIGGEFTNYNGTTINRIARLNADGSLDTSFNPGTGVNNNVMEIINQPNGRIIIAGFFTSYNGTTRNRIARVNSNGSLDTAFDPGIGADDRIYSAFLQSNGRITIAGSFTSYNGTTRNRIARLNANGSLDTSYNPLAGANDDINTAVLQNDGKILIGGRFTSYFGIDRNRIARVNGGSCTTVLSVDVINTCSPHTWIDGILYTTNNNTATYLLEGAAQNGCDSLVTLNLTIIQDVDADVLGETTICSNTASTVSVDLAKPSYNYTLRNNQDNSVVAGPISGSGEILEMNTGILSETTTFNVLAEKAPNTSLQFDGTDDRVHFGNPAAMDFTNDFTIETWVKPTTGGAARQGIFSSRLNNNSGSFQLEIGAAQNGTRRFGVSGVLNWLVQTPNNVYELDEWVHVAYTKSGSGSGTHKLFVNGVEQASSSSSSYVFSNNASSKILGSGTSNTQFLNGSLDEFRIWNYARSEAEIAQSMNQELTGEENGLISYLKFNELAETTTAYDNSGNGIHGTLTNMNSANARHSDTPFQTGGCSNQLSQTVTVEITAASEAPSAVTSLFNLCHGGSTQLEIQGGSLSDGAQWEWFSGSCSSTAIGTGSTLEVSPNASTTYYARASQGNVCPPSDCESVVVNLPVTSTNLALNGQHATCFVNQNGWVHFYNEDGNLIASIQSNGEDLGSVQVTSYVANTAYQTSACDDEFNPSFYQANLPRTFVITPEHQPTNPVQVRLYILDEELVAYQNAALATTQNPHDDIATISDLNLTKISGGAGTGNPADFCGSNGTAQFVLQNTSGDINATEMSGFTGTYYLEFTIDSFSEFFPMNANNSALPVSLTNFSTNCKEDKIQISWSTASEFNASHYLLQSSRDGYTWMNTTQINAAGTTNQTSNYSYEDQNFGALTYYRLLQIDNDGKQEVFGPITSNCYLENNLISVFPNPTSDNFTVLIQTSESFENSTVELVDMSGRVILSQTTNINAGSTMLNFDGKELHAGTYMIRVKGQNDKFTPIRVVKM